MYTHIKETTKLFRHIIQATSLILHLCCKVSGRIEFADDRRQGIQIKDFYKSYS